MQATPVAWSAPALVMLSGGLPPPQASKAREPSFSESHWDETEGVSRSRAASSASGKLGSRAFERAREGEGALESTGTCCVQKQEQTSCHVQCRSGLR